MVKVNKSSQWLIINSKSSLWHCHGVWISAKKHGGTCCQKRQLICGPLESAKLNPTEPSGFVSKILLIVNKLVGKTLNKWFLK